MLADAVLGLVSLAVGIGSVFLYGTVRGGDAEAALVDLQPTVAADELTPPAPGPGAQSPALAVESFLTAELNGATETAFNLLSAEDRASYPNAEVWAARRATTFGVVLSWSWEGSGPSDPVLATKVRSEPRLSPTTGWTPAETVVAWKLVDEDGWRVSLGDSTKQAVLPPTEGAVLVARQWLQDPARCAPGSPTAVTLGLDTYPGQLGRLCDPVAAPLALPDGETSAPASGRAAAELATRYGGDASIWARVVPLTGETALLLAAIGDRWVVIDVVPRSYQPTESS